MSSQGATPRVSLSPKGLIYESDPFLLRLMMRVFESRFSMVGHTEWKEDGDDWREFQFVIADITMMSSEHLDLARDLSRSGFRGPLIFLTGTSIDDGLSDKLAADGIAFIDKPFAPRDLLALVSTLTGRSQSRPQANPRQVRQMPSPSDGRG